MPLEPAKEPGLLHGPQPAAVWPGPAKLFPGAQISDHVHPNQSAGPFPLPEAQQEGKNHFLNTHPNALHVNPDGYSSRWQNNCLGEHRELSLPQTKDPFMNFAPIVSTAESLKFEICFLGFFFPEILEVPGPKGSR